MLMQHDTKDSEKQRHGKWMNIKNEKNMSGECLHYLTFKARKIMYVVDDMNGNENHQILGRNFLGEEMVTRFISQAG